MVTQFTTPQFTNIVAWVQLTNKSDAQIQIHHVPVYPRFPQTISVYCIVIVVQIFFIILLNMPLSHGEKKY